MTIRRPRLVILGMMTAMPVAGVVWQYIHYLRGFEDLGYEVWYVEDQQIWPAVGWETYPVDPAPAAADYIRRSLAPIGLGERWFYRARHSDDRVYGGTRQNFERLLRGAGLIINLHGATIPREEHVATNRLVYLETDPTRVQIEIAEGRAETLEMLDAHVALFSFGENIGQPGCLLPTNERYPFIPTRQPVVLEFWSDRYVPQNGRFTTIASWRQSARPVQWQGRTYLWSKDEQFRKYLRLPALTGQSFELALDPHSYEPSDRHEIEAAGWAVSDGFELSQDQDAYRDFIASSTGEFTVAKEQNTFFGTGWFSDRSATYLAAGRPVVTQDTGFGRVLPTGMGLHAFSSMDEARASIEVVLAEPRQNQEKAADIAREYFSHEVVLGNMLRALGMPVLAASRSMPA